MNWRVAKSLLKLKRQVDAAAPDRAIGSDGTIGDEHHQASTSDHNPWVRDGNTGVVTAMDITHDPRHGVDTYKMATALLASRDPRIKYIISNRKIASATIEPYWNWRPYHGSNPHDHHVHISVSPNKQLYDDERPWNFGTLTPDGDAPAGEERPVLRSGSGGDDVKYLQQLLHIKVDGVFGKAVKAAVIEFQKQHSLIIDGVVGPYTWKTLLAP